jgi:hypothetical protein
MQQEILEMTEHLPTAVRSSDEMIQSARRAGFRTHEVVAEFNSLTIAHNLGDWSAPLDLEQERYAEMAAQLPFFAPMMTCLLGVRRRARGERVDLPWRDSSMQLDEDETMAWVRLCEGLAADDAATAWAKALQACELISHIGYGDDVPFVFSVASDLVLEAGPVAGSHPGPEELLAFAGGPRAAVPRSLRGHRSRLRGAWAARWGGDPVAAEAELREAVEHYRAWGSPLFVARAEADLALALDRQGRHEEATRARATARDPFVRLGATGWLAELDRVGTAT